MIKHAKRRRNARRERYEALDASIVNRDDRGRTSGAREEQGKFTLSLARSLAITYDALADENPPRDVKEDEIWHARGTDNRIYNPDKITRRLSFRLARIGPHESRRLQLSQG